MAGQAVYCANNPLKYIDPTGEWYYDFWGDLEEEWGDDEWTLGEFYDNLGVSYNPYDLSSLYSSLKDGNIDSEYILDFLINSEEGGAKHLAEYKEAFNWSNTFFENLNNSIYLSAKGKGYDGTVFSDAASGGGDNRAHVISVSNGMAAIGPVGGMVDIGAVIDSEGNSKLYLTVGYVFGFGATAGVGYSTTSKKTTLDSFKGRGEGASLSVPFTPVGVEGYGDLSDNDRFGNNYKGGGGNVGVGAGWFGYISYTFLFSPPSREFWLYPGSKR